MIEGLCSFYLQQPGPQKNCLLALRDIILGQDADVTETIKHGMPCFCYLWTDRKTAEPYILFVEGKLLNHPELEAGSRARMKILRVNPAEDLTRVLIESLLNEALDLYRSGKIKV